MADTYGVPERPEVDGDPADAAEEFVAAALQGGSWETRGDGEGRHWVERGVGEGTQRFFEVPLSYFDACKIEDLLLRLRGEDETENGHPATGETEET